MFDISEQHGRRRGVRCPFAPSETSLPSKCVFTPICLSGSFHESLRFPLDGRVSGCNHAQAQHFPDCRVNARTMAPDESRREQNRQFKDRRGALCPFDTLFPSSRTVSLAFFQSCEWRMWTSSETVFLFDWCSGYSLWRLPMETALCFSRTG